jgi:hypothetical protein
MINFTLASDANRHVCELQLAHDLMLTARKGLPGHVVYARVRNATEILEKLELDPERRSHSITSRLSGIDATTSRARLSQLLSLGCSLNDFRGRCDGCVSTDELRTAGVPDSELGLRGGHIYRLCSAATAESYGGVVSLLVGDAVQMPEEFALGSARGGIFILPQPQRERQEKRDERTEQQWTALDAGVSDTATGQRFVYLLSRRTGRALAAQDGGKSVGTDARTADGCAWSSLSLDERRDAIAAIQLVTVPHVEGDAAQMWMWLPVEETSRGWKPQGGYGSLVNRSCGGAAHGWPADLPEGGSRFNGARLVSWERNEALGDQRWAGQQQLFYCERMQPLETPSELVPPAQPLPGAMPVARAPAPGPAEEALQA